MAGATLRYIVYDLLGDLKQLYDDADISPYKVLYWVMIHASRLRKQHQEKISSGAYVTKFDVVVTKDPATNRHYFELPTNIYDYDNDEGIDYVTYAPSVDPDIPAFASVTFTRTTPSESARLYFREDERPLPGNPYFYRLGKRIYLLGTETINLTALETGLKSDFDPTDVNLDMDQEFEFPQDLIPTLKRQVLDLGRFILQVPRDLKNDGAGMDSGQFPTQKLVSVNPQETNIGNQQDNNGY